ncbi:MAG: tyrosine-type recombinase/integrase [Flavobacterium sp.]|uniref:tyrosine-type recombinase/integrase n=1 Tax=Flavobacterium sp. TaxID=239 RepID=UPI003BA44E41
MKPNYSEPKIYTGGVDINKWNKLSKEEQKAALEKDWYIYYSFRNPKTGKLERQNNFKGGINRSKSKVARMKFLLRNQRNLSMLLEKGFNPYELTEEQPPEFVKPQEHEPNIESIEVATVEPTKVSVKAKEQEVILHPIKESLELVLKVKENVLSKTSLPNFKSNVKKFEKWLYENGYEGKSIQEVTKKTVIEYLNEILIKTSARTRNNARIDLSSIFQTLEDNEIIRENFVRKINVLKSTPERNKTYSNTLQQEIFEYMETNDPHLLLYVKFLCYSFLRPIEIGRLKVGDVDVVNRIITFKAKNSPVKTKIIPEILFKELPDLSKMDKNLDLFTPDSIGGVWDTEETNKRDYFSKRFKKIKKHFNLDKNYGLYSFRHTFITKLYNDFIKTMTQNEAKSKLMLISGHKTMDALDKYLRDIDAMLPEDYSGSL